MANEKNKAAAFLGKLGGSVRSDTKADAVRQNGALGGRPTRFEADETERSLLYDLVDRDLQRLKRNRDADPEWATKLWDEQIVKCEALLAKFSPGGERINLSRMNALTLTQLAAAAIARLERAESRATEPSRGNARLLEQTLAVAQRIDALVGEPSVLAHYLREERQRF